MTKILNKELNIDVNLIKAVESYISTLKNNNKSSYSIHRSKYYLLKLSEHAYGIEINGISYRHAVNELLENIEIEDKTFCINLARSFYPFWKNAYSALIEVKPDQINKASLKHNEFADLWNTADELFLSDTESWHINLYKNAMQRAGAIESEVKARVKMAKLILNELRNHEQTSEGFRIAVEIIGANFLRDQSREYFQVVSREFYPFWMDTDSQTEA